VSLFCTLLQFAVNYLVQLILNIVRPETTRGLLQSAHRRLVAPLPTIIQASIKVDGVETFTNTTRVTEEALDLNLIQGDIL
jgi:hypothetical protein